MFSPQGLENKIDDIVLFSGTATHQKPSELSRDALNNKECNFLHFLYVIHTLVLLMLPSISQKVTLLDFLT